MRSKETALRAGTLALTLALIVPTAALAGGLEAIIEKVEVQASADLGGFKADLSATFGVPEPQIEGMFEIFPKASDVYMCLRVGEVAHQPLDRIVEVYERHRGQGWGEIAKNLGIKPGSEAFHALKSGRLVTDDGGTRDATGPGGRGKGKGAKGKGRH